MFLVINSALPRPDEVTQALLLTLSINPEGLREADVFKLGRSLIIFSRLEVRAVKIHGDEGRAEVRIREPLIVAGGQAHLRKRQEIQTWTLRRRDQKSWELLLPQDAIYIPRDAAVRVLAHELALLADAEDSSTNLREKSQLAHTLNTAITVLQVFVIRDISELIDTQGHRGSPFSTSQSAESKSNTPKRRSVLFLCHQT